MSRSHIPLTSAIKKLSKHGIVEHNNNGQYWAKINGHIVSFIKNGEDSTTCYHTKRIGEYDDPQTDYFAGEYWNNLTQAIRYAEEGHSKKW
jgi:hypothetical protein